MSHTKSIQQFASRLTPEYIKQKYPLYFDFLKSVLKYIDTQNTSGWYSTTEQKKANSIYQNYYNLIKLNVIDEIPVQNKDILYSHFLNWSVMYDSSNLTKLQSDEYLRQFIKYSNIIFRTKGTYKSIDLLIILVKNSIVQGENETVYAMIHNYGYNTINNPTNFYYTIAVANNTGYVQGETITENISLAKCVIVSIDDNTTDLIVRKTDTRILSIGNLITGEDSGIIQTIVSVTEGIDYDKIVFTELPVYEHVNGIIEKTDRIMSDKGKYPFHYQIASNNPIIKDEGFVKSLQTIHPSGFLCDIIGYSDYIIVNLNNLANMFIHMIIELKNTNI